MSSASTPEASTVSSLVGPKAVIAVVAVDSADDATELARVLADAGIAALEITLRTDAALPAIEATAALDLLPVGAGTVLDEQQVDSANARGAQFLVSPGYHDELAHYIVGLGSPYLPGVISPSDIQAARRRGFTELKVFPVEQFGGLGLINTFASVFPEMSFAPSGGINQQHAADYLAHPSVTAIGGSWIAPSQLVREHAWDEISRRCEAVRAVQLDQLATEDASV